MIGKRIGLVRSLKGVVALLSVSLAAGLAGCGGSGPTTITIQGPASSNVDPGNAVTFTATVANDSNSAGVTWTLTGTGCTGAGCGVLSGSSTTTVTYTAPTTVGTAFSVTITASSVSKTGVVGTVTVNVPVNLGITTTAGALAGATVGTAYSVTLAAVGGVAPNTWTVTTGTLPPGLSLNASTGAITGTPTTAGSVTFTVTVKDSGSPAASSAQTFTIGVAAPPAITFTTTTLAGGTVGTAYSASVAATGGAGGLTYALGSGTLPAGLTLSSAGAISGTPTKAGTSTITVKATDAYGDTGVSGTLSIAVVYPAVTISTTTLANGTVGTAYSATLSASGGSGSGYTWTVTSGTGLSAVGLTLSTAGAVTGTPTAGETAGTFVVKVTDGAGNTGLATITLTVVYPALTVTTANLTNGVAGVAYSVNLTAGGGSGNGFTWTVTSGGTNLTAMGLSVSSAGVLSGNTPTVGTASFTVKVTDSANDSATANLSVTINAGLSVTTTTLPNGTVGTAYSANLLASGGTGTGNTWTVTGGTGLSAVGLSLSSGGVISGTPTAQEAATQFTVKVTDSGGDTATATLALIVNYAALSISTTTIPGAVANSPYSEQFVAAGGSGNYTWSVTSNAGGLSGESLTLTTGGLLSGTPTTVESVPFTLQVKDTTTSNTVSASYTLVVSSGTVAQCTHDGSGNALLNGGYAFLLGGFDPSGNHYYQIGDFTADGSGHITGGNGDVNSSGFATQGEQQYTFTGTYSIGSTDNRGSMTMISSNASTGLPAAAEYCFAADTVGSVNGKTVAQSGRIIEADGSGFVVTGFFAIQNTASFTNSALNAGYAFGVEGVNSGSGEPQRAGVIGQMMLNGTGGIPTGQIDIAQFNQSTGTTTYQAAVSGGGGTYSVTSTGRGTLTVGSGSSSDSFVTYVAGNGNMLFMLSADNINTGTLLFGRAQQQTTTSFTTANAKATAVLAGIGAAYVSTSSSSGNLVDDVTVGEGNFDGSGGLSLVLDQNSGGTIKPTKTGTGTYTVSSLGYVQVTGVGSNSPNFYLYAPGAGFGMTGDPKVTTMDLLPQTIPSGGFTSSSLSGNYSLGTIPPVAYSASGAGVTSGSPFPYVMDGTIVAGVGPLSLTSDQNQAPGLPADIAVDKTSSNTWALDSTYGSSAGKFTVATGGGAGVLGYIVSPTQAVIIDYQSGNDPSLYEVDHQ